MNHFLEAGQRARHAEQRDRWFREEAEQRAMMKAESNGAFKIDGPHDPKRPVKSWVVVFGPAY